MRKKSLPEEEVEKSKIVFVKNLNFSSTEEDLRSLIDSKKLKGVKNVKIVRSNGKSQGFGFVEFETEEQSEEMIKTLQNTLLDKHVLKLSISKKKTKEEEKGEKKEVQKSTKLILKNIAFQATKQELKELLSNLLSFKSLRFPKKIDNTPKGYAFLEMKSIEDSEQAIETIKNLHFYGRKIVAEYAHE